MKKTYKFFLALVLCVLGGMSANAEEISLQEVPFCSWDGWGADAKSTGTASCAWVVGESTGMPYGDSQVINYADLSNFTKLVVVATEGTPRIMFNRDVDEGQFNADESQSHLIEYPKPGTWVDKYFSTAPGEKEGETVYTVDLKQIVKDKGFAHLHAIKGANWANVTVTSMILVRAAKAPVGWTSIITNGGFESDDFSSFVLAIDAVNNEGTTDVTAENIEAEAGVNGSNALVVNTIAGATEDWATQLFVKLGEPVTEGLQWRFTMDVKADAAAKVSSGSHAAPREWKAGGIIPEFDVTTDWTSVEASGTITKELADAGFASIAFDLNKNREEANKFYFDNINFEVFKLGTVAEFSNDVILLDFGFDTNVAQLVKKSGKKRLLYPNDCVTVKVNGNAVDIYSVEGFEDGRFYIFLEEAVEENDDVLVSFKNPSDAAFQLVYASGSMNGQVIKDVEDLAATPNAEVEDNDGYPYDYLTPVVMKADPENGSFNLPNSIKEFKFTFDKDIDCEALTATLNGQPLTVTPATGFAAEVTLGREGADLATGEYQLRVTKIYPKIRLDDKIFGDTTLVLNIGKPEYNPNDTLKQMIPLEYFANCGANSIPEGYFVKFGSEDRPGGQGYGSGSRMFNFAAGGDFTKGLYFREGYVEYGTTLAEGEEVVNKYALKLEAGKKYEISFNTAMWKDNGTKTRFEIFFKDDFDAANQLGETPTALLTKVVDNKPNVNGGTGAVNGSTKTVFNFVPENTGNYVVRWVSSTAETGDPAYLEIILANPAVKYIPNQAGIEYVQLLNNALADAKSVRDGNATDRYSGADYDALTAAIDKYDVEKENYTNPSAYEDAAANLTALADAMKAHHALCDDYDNAIKKAIDVIRQNEYPDGGQKPATKFVATEQFAQLKAAVEKYHGSSAWKTDTTFVNNEETQKIDTIVGAAYLVYNFDVLKEAEVLNSAIAELKDLANLTSLLFTEGKSAPDNSNNGKGTGAAVFFERTRLGIDLLKQLGVAEDDALIVEASKAINDDDNITDAIKNRAKLIIFGNLKEANPTLFAEVVDEETLVSTTPEYDLTVFVKNPNIYKQETNMNFTESNVPGWVTPEGFNKPGLSVGWGQPKNVAGIAEDCMFQSWGGSYRVEQTVVDLPAGVYTLKAGFSERNGSDPGTVEGTFFYAKTSDTPAVEEGMEEDPEVNFAGVANADAIGQAFPFWDGTGSLEIPSVVVTDGILTFGVNAPAESHTFFNEVRLFLTAAAEGYDYASDYQVIAEGIENVSNNAKVRAIQLYDLNGRRISNARQGIVIVKKFMSDGSVRTEKVIKK